MNNLIRKNVGSNADLNGQETVSVAPCSHVQVEQGDDGDN
jgi:hypothetical protein